MPTWAPVSLLDPTAFTAVPTKPSMPNTEWLKKYSTAQSTVSGSTLCKVLASSSNICASFAVLTNLKSHARYVLYIYRVDFKVT